MNPSLRTILMIASILTMLAAFGCTSTSEGPVTPSNNAASNDLVLSEGDVPDGRTVLATLHVSVDPVTGEATVTENREVQKHFNISNFMGPNMDITWETYQESDQLWIFDLQLHNPTEWTAYDVRGVFIPNPWSGDYLENADDYTHMWNTISYEWVNGFKAYAKNVDGRAFTPGAYHTEQFRVHKETPAEQVFEYEIVIEVSFPGNCFDPYQISGQYTSGNVTPFSPTTISVEVYNHSGYPSTYVWIDTSAITGDVTYLTHQSGTTWSAQIYNSMGAQGLFECKITADNYYGPDQENYDEQLHDFIDIWASN